MNQALEQIEMFEKPYKPKGLADQICDEVGLKITRWDLKPYKPKGRVTRARGSIKRLIQRHGEDHLRLCLKLIFFSEANRHIKILYASQLMAVSDVVRAHREWENSILDAMHQISLQSLYERWERLKIGEARFGMALLLASEIEAFGKEEK